MNKNHFRKRTPTLSGRLVMLFIGVAVLFVIAIATTMGWAFRGHFDETMRPHLMQYINYVQNDIGAPPQFDKAKDLAKQLNINIHFKSNKESWSTDGQSYNFDHSHYFREFTVNGVEYGFGHHGKHEYMISRHPDYTLAFSTQRQGGGWHKLVIVFIVLMILVLFYYATRKLFSPIAQLKYGVEQIGSGNLNHRIDIRRRDELGELGKSINGMADEIQQMLEAKRQLLLAISHELRSPLTRAKVSAELIEDEKRRDDIHHDLNEMEALIEEILETERLSTNHQALRKSSCVVQELIKALIEENFHDQALTLDLPTNEIHAEVDTTRIKLLLRNLVDNALRHNAPEGEPPKISMDTEASKLTISVQDFGEGIEPEHIPHLTEPFYRVDPARQRQTGGYGLGLYLCKVIAQAHDGHLEVESKVNVGTTTRVTLTI